MILYNELRNGELFIFVGVSDNAPKYKTEKGYKYLFQTAECADAPSDLERQVKVISQEFAPVGAQALTAELADLDEAYKALQEVTHAYPTFEKQTEAVTFCGEIFYKRKMQIEVKYGLPLHLLRRELMDNEGFIFSRTFGGTMKNLILIGILFVSACGLSSQAKRSENTQNAPETANVAVVKETSSHLCGFIGKNGKPCTRKVANKNGSYCFQHRGQK